MRFLTFLLSIASLCVVAPRFTFTPEGYELVFMSIAVPHGLLWLWQRSKKKKKDMKRFLSERHIPLDQAAIFPQDAKAQKQARKKISQSGPSMGGKPFGRDKNKFPGGW